MTMSAPRDPTAAGRELCLLQLLRLKGRAKAEDLAGSLDADQDDVTQAVSSAVDSGFCSESGPSLRLTPDGKQRLSELLDAERATVDQRSLAGRYEEFESVNTELKSIVTAWQMKDDDTPNDHTDAEYDQRVVERLQSLHTGFLPLLERIVGEVPRLGAYAARFGNAMEKVLAGEHQYVARPILDSYHTVWFELHEELIGLLGRTRADEAAAGRAV